MPATVEQHIRSALEYLTLEAWDAAGNPSPYFYTLAEELNRIQSAIGGGPFAAIGERVKDAAVELRLALETLGK